MSRQERCPVVSVTTVSGGCAVLRFTAPVLAASAAPGQFVNVRVDESTDPLLRRPFSVYRTEGEDVEILFQVIGRGTSRLRLKQKGDPLDVLGPLGVPFSVTAPDFATGILVGGGLGVAPLPMLTAALQARGMRVITLLGARSASLLVEDHLQDPHIATDDGSRGFSGSVVSLLSRVLDEKRPPSPRIFACGPNAMLRALADLALGRGIPCEVSLEGPMGCGFGICQGCPVELVDQPKRFALMCTDGPAFDIRKIRIPG